MQEKNADFISLLPISLSQKLSRSGFEVLKIIGLKYLNNPNKLEIIELDTKDILKEANHKRNWLNKALRELERHKIIERIASVNSHIRKVRIFPQYFLIIKN